MKQQSLFIAAYAVLLVIGGLIGYITAGSLASIMMSSLFAIGLVACSYFVSKGNSKAYDCAIGLVAFLLLFFGYRFFLGFKIMPGGMMFVLSGILLAYLINRRSSQKVVQ